MKITVVGGGPSGLYLAYLVKRDRPGDRVLVIEQNPPDATFGFGVVMADGGLQQLRQVDEQSFERIMRDMYWVDSQRFCHGGDWLWIDKKRPGGAIERIKLLNTLQSLCIQQGVELVYEQRLDDSRVLADADLVVGADGANSTIRRMREAEFGVNARLLGNRFAWYGVDKVFDSSYLDFRFIPGGALVGHFYPYSSTHSTFVMECDASTWTATGMDRMTDDERREFTQSFFVDRLSGRALIANKAVWRQFSVVAVDRWHIGNWVLIGDALRPAHYSIGSGTRLAMEDSIALYRSIVKFPGNVPAILDDFVRERAPIKAKLMSASENSYTWYEKFQSLMRENGLVGLAHNFLTRTGRITPERLVAEFPRFMERYRRESGQVSDQLNA